MSLSPDQIQAMNQATGLNKPVTPTQAVGQSRADEIRALGKAATPAPQRGVLGEILPTGGAILGGILGAAGGAAAGIETGPGAAATGYAGGVAGSAAGGALGEAAQQGIEKMTGARQSFEPGEIGKTGAEMGALEAVGGPVADIAGKVVKAGGEALAKAVIPTSKAEAKLIQTYQANVPFWQRVLTGVTGKGPKAPVTTAQTTFDKGLLGTESMLGVQAKRASNNLWNNLISPALKSSDTKVNMPSFFSDLEKNIVNSTPERARQNDLLTALNALREDYKDVGEVSLSDLQKFKEGWAKFVPEKAYQGKPIAGAFNDVKDMAAGNARSIIYDSLGNEVKQGYFDYGNLKGVQELGQKAMTGQKLKGGTGTFVSALKDSALTPVGTIGGQTIYKAGQGIELLGKPGARFVRDIIPAFGDTGKNISGTSQTE